MKKIVMFLLTFVLIISMSSVSLANNGESGSATNTELQESNMAKEALMLSLDRENLRLANEFSENEVSDLPYSSAVGSINSNATADGVHVATRKSNSNSYNEIQTMFTLGSNINAASGAAVYFMHYLGKGSLSVDSGIYYQGGSFYIFNYGTIACSNNWHSEGGLNISPGDTVYVNSKLTSTKIITSVIKNGTTVATLTDTLTASHSGVGVVREFNIAAHNTINNTNSYFSWS